MTIVGSRRKLCSLHYWEGWYWQLHHPQQLAMPLSFYLLWTRMLLLREICRIYLLFPMASSLKYVKFVVFWVYVLFFGISNKIYFFFHLHSSHFFQVARGRTAVQIAKEKLDLLIGQYREQLGMRNLEFMSVSGSTHLIEVIPLFNWLSVLSAIRS